MRIDSLRADEFLCSFALVSLLLIKTNASPNARPAAYPRPIPLPKPTAVSNPDPQTINIYGPFSGAIYIVPASGSQAYSPASPAQCPNYAPEGCGNINQYNW
jgi:hypothetical protein